MEKLACFFLFGTIIVQSTIPFEFSETAANEKPKANKLTISIDSVSQRLPPQIAYFIPEKIYNRSFDFNFNRNLPQPPIINMWPSNDPRNNGTFNNFSETDLIMSQQQQYRYIAVPKNQKVSFVEDEPTTAYQNFNYQIDFAQIPDKEPDFKRFKSIARKPETVKSVKSKKNMYTKRPDSISTNYANTLTNIRSRNKHIKIDHENKFKVSKNKEHLSGSVVGRYSDERGNDVFNGSKVYNNDAKLKKSPRKKPQYLMNKHSHPTPIYSSVENESGLNYDDTNIDGMKGYYTKHSNHENCDHPDSDVTEKPENENGNENESKNINCDDTKNNMINTQPKGFAIYLSKVIKHPKPYRALRTDKNKISHYSDNGFVPTRIISSVRGENIVLHKPRKMRIPTIRERFRETGGHIVYTEDGYENKEYDHSVEDRSLEYLSRTRRSTSLKDLRGQELIDHLDNLIRNVSEYLNSSEIIPENDKQFPLYNIPDDSIKDSPIKYSEYAKPIVDGNFSSELYESKSENCEDIDENIDLSNAHNDTTGPKKRLGNLGNKLDCLKKKLFGKNPLNNPLFQENKIYQPNPNKIYSNIQQETEHIQTISEIVHSDVMDNIKHNSFNENQRIFSNYGVSDNFAVGTFNSNPVTVRPTNELNTNEKYTFESKEKNDLEENHPVIPSSLRAYNPFKDPSQLPILDISKFIPTPKYSPTDSGDDIPLQTDFVPIFSPYSSYRTVPTTTTTMTTTTIAPVTHSLPKLYNPVRNQGLHIRKAPYYNTYRTPMQNILLFKNRRPVAVVHVIPNNRSGPRA